MGCSRTGCPNYASRSDNMPQGPKNEGWDRTTTKITHDGQGWIEVIVYPNGARIFSRRDDITEPAPVSPRKKSKETPLPEGPPLSLYSGTRRYGHFDGAPGDAEFTAPQSVVISEDGSLYVMEPRNYRVRKVARDGQVTTFTGQKYKAGIQDGVASLAWFCIPMAGVFGPDGDLYVTDAYNQRIRKITMTGDREVFTAAGTGEIGHRDGPASQALLNSPMNIDILPDGRLVFTEMHGARIRLFDTEKGIVETLVGGGTFGTADGSSSTAQFLTPFSLATDSKGNVYTTNYVGLSDSRIRKIDAKTGDVTTFAGLEYGFCDGKGTNAMFRTLHGLTCDNRDNLWASDGVNARIRKISPDGETTTVVGHGVPGFSNGPDPPAKVNYPLGLTSDSEGNIYFADSCNNCIRKIESLLKPPPTPMLFESVREAEPTPEEPLEAVPGNGTTEIPEQESQRPSSKTRSRTIPERSSPFHNFLKDTKVQEEIKLRNPGLSKTELLEFMSGKWNDMTESEKAAYDE